VVAPVGYAGGVQADSPGCAATPGHGCVRRKQPWQGLQPPGSSHPCRGADSKGTPCPPGACCARPGAIRSNASGVQQSSNLNPQTERKHWGQICPFDIWFKGAPTKSRPSGLSGDAPQNLSGLCNRATPAGSLFARLWIAFDSRPHVKPSSRHLSRMTSPHPSSGHDATPRPCQFAAPLAPLSIYQMDRSAPLPPA
jgi:hypothetical protein